MLVYALLFASGFLASAVNAVAGGGTLFTFTALVASGLDPLSANATNAVAVWPGRVTAVLPYRARLGEIGKRALWIRTGIAFIGGGLGALLLLGTSDALFTTLVPWLLLLATLLFAAGPALERRARATRLAREPVARGTEFLFATYGGFFGAGLGVLLMAALNILGVRDPQDANAQKNMLSTIITTVSVAIFVFADLVEWSSAAVVVAGSLIGGYQGSKLAQRLSPVILRTLVIVVGLALSAYYFLS